MWISSGTRIDTTYDEAAFYHHRLQILDESTIARPWRQISGN